MDAERWRKAETLFEELLELPAGERAVRIAEVCGHDQVLRADVERLLVADAQVGPLDTNNEIFQLVLDAEASRPAEDKASSAYTGARIGAYRVLRDLGQGGMGDVFLAERADGQFEQKVALKVIKRGMDTEGIRRRFLAERQILARLAHPHIARLLDGGVTEDQRPFFVVEYVEGTPLMAHCEAHALGRPARLALFAQVCDAVEYAHRNLVVHRDLKPSNILVTASGEVKLLDFGIAKVLEPTTEEHELTGTGERLMTPAYAAPEQLRGESTTTAVDVWALGVILCELLTGTRPTRTAVPRIDDVDLRTIVQVALREEASRRYASAGALREDVQRYLGGFPIQARADTLGYRTRKFVSRHRAGTAIGVATTLALAATGGALLWQARVAVREGAKARAVQDFMLSVFEVSDPDEAKGEKVTAREILDRGAARLEHDLAGQPDVAAEARGLIGSLYRRLGLLDRARPLLERNVAWQRERGTRPALADALELLADAREDAGRLDEAEPLRREVLALRNEALGRKDPRSAKAAGDLARLLFRSGGFPEAERLLGESLPLVSLGQSDAEHAMQLTTLAMIKYAQGDYRGGEPLVRRSLDIRLRLYGERHSLVIETLANLAAYRSIQGDYAEAETLMRRVLSIDMALFGEEHEKVAIDLNNLARTLQERGQFEEAEMLARRALAQRTQVLGADNPQLAVNLHSLGSILRDRGRYDEGTELLRRAVAMNSASVGDQHPYQAFALGSLALTLAEGGHQDEAESLFRRSLGLFETLNLRNHAKASEVKTGLGLLLVDSARASEAEPILREALEVARGAHGDASWRAAAAGIAVGRCLAALGRDTEARAMLQENLAALSKAGRSDHPAAGAARRALDALPASVVAAH